jgi:hypothetical protein
MGAAFVLVPEDSTMDVYGELMRIFGKRMACMVISAVQLSGEHAGKQNTSFYPGFVISVRGQWLFVTAGHNIREVDDALQEGQIRLVTARFLDCFSPDAPYRDSATASFPFDYCASKRAGIFFDFDDSVDQLDGRDFGFVKISDSMRQLLESNGIRALEEHMWLPPVGTVLEEHILVGIPKQLIDVEKGKSEIVYRPENVCIPLKPPSSSPSDLDQAKHQRLVLELPDDMPIAKVAGMSGGPIFAIGDGPEGRGRVWVVGIQSKQKGRLLFAFPFEQVVRYIDEALADLESTG